MVKDPSMNEAIIALQSVYKGKKYLKNENNLRNAVFLAKNIPKFEQNILFFSSGIDNKITSIELFLAYDKSKSKEKEAPMVAKFCKIQDIWKIFKKRTNPKLSDLDQVFSLTDDALKSKVIEYLMFVTQSFVDVFVEMNITNTQNSDENVLSNSTLELTMTICNSDVNEFSNSKVNKDIRSKNELNYVESYSLIGLCSFLRGNNGSSGDLKQIFGDLTLTFEFSNDQILITTSTSFPSDWKKRLLKVIENLIQITFHARGIDRDLLSRSLKGDCVALPLNDDIICIMASPNNKVDVIEALRKVAWQPPNNDYQQFLKSSFSPKTSRSFSSKMTLNLNVSSLVDLFSFDPKKFSTAARQQVVELCEKLLSSKAFLSRCECFNMNPSWKPDSEPKELILVINYDSSLCNFGNAENLSKELSNAVQSTLLKKNRRLDVVDNKSFRIVSDLFDLPSFTYSVKKEQLPTVEAFLGIGNHCFLKLIQCKDLSRAIKWGGYDGVISLHSDSFTLRTPIDDIAGPELLHLLSTKKVVEVLESNQPYDLENYGIKFFDHVVYPNEFFAQATLQNRLKSILNVGKLPRIALIGSENVVLMLKSCYSYIVDLCYALFNLSSTECEITVDCYFESSGLSGPIENALHRHLATNYSWKDDQGSFVPPEKERILEDAFLRLGSRSRLSDFNDDGIITIDDTYYIDLSLVGHPRIFSQKGNNLRLLSRTQEVNNSKNNEDFNSKKSFISFNSVANFSNDEDNNMTTIIGESKAIEAFLRKLHLCDQLLLDKDYFPIILPKSWSSSSVIEFVHLAQRKFDSDSIERDAVNSYTINFPKSISLEDVNSFVQKIKELEKEKLPFHWEVGNVKEKARKVELSLDDPLYLQISKVFLHNFPVKILKIEEIQNPYLYQAFRSKKELMNKVDNGDERYLFHGTRTTDPALIWEGKDGFDFRLSAQGMFGTGAYFAEDVNYSHRGYRHILPDGSFQIFVGIVLPGKIEQRQSDSSIKKPSEGYDSIRGLVTSSDYAIIVYDLAQCYPGFLVTYSLNSQ